MARKSRYDQIRDNIQKGLLQQLGKTEKIQEHHRNLIDDYMAMWDTKNGLVYDIRMRGEKVEVVTGSGTNIKTNDSVTDLLKVNAQMIKLLDSLGIKPEPAEEEDEEM